MAAKFVVFVDEGRDTLQCCQDLMTMFTFACL